MVAVRDDLDAYLDSGKARYGGVALAEALEEATGWAEARGTRRRRARAWFAGGLAAAVLAGGGAVATAMGDDTGPAGADYSFALRYLSNAGAICEIVVTPTVHATKPEAWMVAREFLQTVDLETVDHTSAQGADGEVAALIDGLERATEDAMSRRILSRVEVTLAFEYVCSTAVTLDDYGAVSPIVGDDFGREPTVFPGRAPDVVGFFRASTGQICEIQMKVDPALRGDSLDKEGAAAVRAYLKSIDFTTVDYSAALDEYVEFWPQVEYFPEDDDQGWAEATALVTTVTRQMQSSFDEPPAVSVESVSQCDPEPAE